MQRALTWVACCVLIADFVPAPVRAQTVTATLRGMIMDQSGAVVPNVRITLLNVETGLERATSAREDGKFAFPLLLPGRYSLIAKGAGFTPSEADRIVLNANDDVSLQLVLKIGQITDAVNVVAEAQLTNMSPAVATVVDRQFVKDLPLNGRSLQSLMTVVPGVVFTGQSQAGIGQFSVNGQRTNANYFTVDGVGANVEAGTNYWAAQEAAGVTPALNAVGGTQSLISIDALEEFTMQTSSYSAEFGRQPGGQVALVSRSGTNQLHGSMFEYFRNNSLTATDWFINANALMQPQLRQNQFGATAGGPIAAGPYDGRNRTFFFFSYEGLRLVQPQTLSTDVPSLSLRAQGWPALQPLLASLPIPTGPENPATRTAPFTAAFSAPSSYDAVSLRVDQKLSEGSRLFGRFSYSPSSASNRNLNNVVTDSPTLWTTTIGLTQAFGSSLSHDLRVNDSDDHRSSTSAQDSFGGAVPVTYQSILPPAIPPSMPVRIQISLDSIASPYFTVGQYQEQRQVNVVDTWMWAKGSHLLKAGVDYRDLRPASQPWEYFYFVRFNSIDSILTGIPSSTSAAIQADERVDMRFHNFGAFMADTWRATQRLTVDAGVRWDLNPGPALADGKKFYTVTGLENPATLRLAPAGTSLYPTDYRAFAPRIGAAYVLSQSTRWKSVLRGAFGLFHDLGTGNAAQATADFPYTRSASLPAGLAYPFTAAAVARPALTSLDPPYNSQTFVAFPDHRTPRTYEWNLALEQALGASQSMTLTYVGAAGRNLVRRETDLLQNANANFTGTTNVDVSRSDGVSDYKALQISFRRRLASGLQALASYTFSKCEDTASNAVIAEPRADLFNPNLYRGPCDFDRRHVFSAAFTYAIPSLRAGIVTPLLRDWLIASTIQVQSASPVFVYTLRDLGFGSISVSPDSVPGVPVYLTDSSAPGGWRLNPAAFRVPVTPQMGDLPRNGIRGFPFHQVDLNVARTIRIESRLSVQLRADIFNVLNTPNFSNPSGYLGSTSPAGVLSPYSAFGRASSSLANTFGGANGVYALYAAGGARSAQLSVRVTF